MLCLCFLGHPGTKGISNIDIGYVQPFVVHLPFTSSFTLISSEWDLVR